MKKTIKSLVIAASVAAIAGIGAVSFAKWQGTATNRSTEVEGNSTGAISVLEFNDVSVFTAITGLKPIDQDDAITSANYQEIKFKVVASEGYDKTDFKLNVTIDSDSTLQSASGIYVSATAPTAKASTGKVTEEGTDVEYTLDSSADHEYTLYVWLQSDDIQDMNKTFTLTYSITEGDTDKT